MTGARLAGLLAAALAGSCATPSAPSEEEGRAPVPSLSSSGGLAPPVLPAAAVEEVQGVLRGATARGSVALPDCFRIAQATSAALLSGEEEALQAWLQRDVVRSAFFPQVNLRGTYFRQNEVTLSSGSTFFTTSPDRTEWALTVFQPLFNGLHDLYALKAAERSAEALEASREDVRRLLLSVVARAFYGVLEAEAEARTLEESERRDDARLEEMRSRFEQGLARRTEVLLVESRGATTRAELLRARTSLDVARSVLEAVLGVHLDAPLEAGPRPQGPIAEVPEAVGEALRSRPDLRAASLVAEGAEAALRSTRGEAWPTLSLSGDRYLARDNFSEFADKTRWDALLTLSVPLTAGGLHDARERIAASRLREARIAQAETSRRIVQEVQAARARAASGEEILRTWETNARSARESLRLLEEEYREGIATNLEVLAAEGALDEARLGLERQQIENRLDHLELDVALGRVAP